MNQFLKYTFYLLIQLGALSLQAQSKIVVEQIQTYSLQSPTANYWYPTEDIHPLLEALDSGVFKQLHLIRDINYTTSAIHLNKSNQMGKITMDWSRSMDSKFHAYIELYEMNPDFAYQNKLIQIPESKKDSLYSIWYISCNIYNQKRESIFKKTILVSMLSTKSIGMGFNINLPATTPNYIFKALQKALGYISPKMEDMDYMEVKVPSAYATDNLWMPFIHNQPRIMFDTSKAYVSYSNEEGNYLLRTPAAKMIKINQKDKSITNPYIEILPFIKKRPGNNENEYYHVLQPLRDVNNDQDYSLDAYIEFSLNSNERNTSISPISFLPGNFNTIFLNQDSIGYFNVQENVVEKDKFFNPNEIFNGFDSTKKINIGTLYEKRKIISEKVIEGQFKSHSFRILINYESNLKTIYIDEKMTMIADGKGKPYQMVTSKSNHDMELRNFLLQMAFSEIFQLPT
jgi:hypothetical protein